MHQINSEVKQKFPEKTTPPLEADLSPSCIISYAYFFKKLLFAFPFAPKQVLWNKKKVPGFEGKNQDQKKQIVVNQYKDQENFIIEQKTKSLKDSFFIVKTEKKITPEEVMAKVQKVDKKGTPLSKNDVF